MGSLIGRAPSSITPLGFQGQSEGIGHELEHNSVLRSDILRIDPFRRVGLVRTFDDGAAVGKQR